MGKPKDTVNGYGFFEVASAFQKAIRRCDEDQAMYWAIELFESGFDEYAWKRMLVMVSEDIGLAEPHLIATMKALYDTFLHIKKKNKVTGSNNHRLQLTHGVIIMARARKSRLVCNAIFTHWEKWEKEDKLEIPDHAYDKHTLKGKKMGRGYEHFLNEAAKLENEAALDRDTEYQEGIYNALVNPKELPKKDNSQFKMKLD